MSASIAAGAGTPAPAAKPDGGRALTGAHWAAIVVLFAILAGWHATLMFTARGVADYGDFVSSWMLGDIAFGLYLPLALPTMVYLLLRNVAATWNELRRCNPWLLRVGAVLFAATLAIVFYGSLDDSRRPTAVPSYHLSGADRTDARTRENEIRAQLRARVHSLRWAPEKKDDADAAARIEDSTNPWVLDDANVLKQCDTLRERLPKADQGVYNLICDYFARSASWQAAGRFGPMRAVNTSFNIGIFAIIAAFFFHLLSFMLVSPSRQVAFRATAIAVLLLLWFPLRLYAEIYINFFVPGWMSIDRYQAYYALGCVMLIATAMLLWTAAPSNLKQYGPHVLSGIFGLVFIWALVDSERRDEVFLHVWKAGPFWLLAVAFVFVIAFGALIAWTLREVAMDVVVRNASVHAGESDPSG